MKKWARFISILTFIIFTVIVESPAQCSICTKTAQQMGEGPGKGLNAGILYLAAAPMMILGFIGYKWYQSNRSS